MSGADVPELPRMSLRPEGMAVRALLLALVLTLNCDV
jgi:hypothetical protein